MRFLRWFTTRMLRTSNHHKLGTTASWVRIAARAASARWSCSSGNAQHAAIDASSTSVISTYALIPGREQFLDGYSRVSFPESTDVFDRLIDFLLPPVYLRHNPRAGSAVAGDNQSLASFDLVEQLRQVDLRFGCLDLAHIRLVYSTSLIVPAEGIGRSPRTGK